MKRTATVIGILLIAAICGYAQQSHFEQYDADGGPAMRVYNGFDETLTISIYAAGASATNEVTCDGNVQNIDGSGTDVDTITEFAAAISACTNATGNASLVVDKDCALDTDSTDGELLDGTYTAVSGAWLEIPWDTSEALIYSVYQPGSIIIDGVNKGAPGSSPYRITQVNGNPAGTGAVTLNIYVEQTKVWESVLNVERYCTGTNSVSLTTVNLPKDMNVRVGAEQGAFVRATRATTATTGNLGFTGE